MYKGKLLNIDANTKTMKGLGKNYSTAGLHLAPYNLSGYQVCPNASPICASVCLNLSGMGRFKNVQAARIAKTKYYFEHRKEFMLQLEKELEAFIKRCKKNNLTPCVRLNVLSDIPWENISYVSSDGKTYKNLMEKFPELNYYDYTKRSNRINLPKNYHLTFSLAEDNEDRALKAIEQGLNVAVVFRKEVYPKKYLGLKVISGTEDDLRFLDPKKRVVGLCAKGPALKDAGGFVKDV